MKIGVVGSRKRKDKEKVFSLVDSLNKKDLVISGDAKGVDSWAEQRAKERGLKVLIYKPKIPKEIKGRWQLTKAYYERNRKIAKNSDIIYAFVSPDRKGGTENTIKWTKKIRQESCYY